MSTTTNFLHDGPSPVQEQNGSGVTANLLTGGIDERFQRTDSTGTYSYLTDALGSTMALTNSTGAEQTTYSYSPHGALSATGSNSNDYSYTGREADGLGMDYFRARYYNPNIGRFLSEDPIGFRAGINFYAYVEDSPLNFNDPLGQDKKNPFQCAADNAENVSLAHALELMGADNIPGGGFAANALGGNAFSGMTDLATSFANGYGGGHSVYYNMAEGLAAGPAMGFGPVVQAVMDANGSNVVMTTLFNGDVTAPSWADAGPADMATDAMVGTAFDEVTGATDTMVTLSGEASMASAAMTGAEFATGFGEAKFAYDFATYAGAYAGCAMGLF